MEYKIMNNINNNKPILGKKYRQIVNSEQGYEDWEYNNSFMIFNNLNLYAMKNDRGVYWFDEIEFNNMQLLN